MGLGKRCKSLINKPLYCRYPAENPRVGGSIPPLATTNSLNINNILIEHFQEARRVCQECAMDLHMPRRKHAGNRVLPPLI